MKNSKKLAQSLIEYGLILALVAIVALTVMSKLGTSVSTAGNNAANGIDQTSKNSMLNYCKSLGKTGYDSSTGSCT